MQANCFLECWTSYARKKSGCTPWYFPVRDNDIQMCDPWETKSFMEYMETIPDGECDYCLPDCISVLYGTSVSSAPFRPCDHTTLGTSSMCELDNPEGLVNPPIWAQEVSQQYQKDTGDVPDYATSGHFNNQRKVVPDAKRPNLVFTTGVDEYPTYDAYKRDIALVRLGDCRCCSNPEPDPLFFHQVLL